MANDIVELLKNLQTAYDDVVAKEAVRQEAAVALDVATQAHKASTDALKTLQDEAGALIGKVLPQSGARMRLSA